MNELTNQRDAADANETGNRSLVLFDRGDEIVVRAGDQGMRFLLVSGKPIEEPVAWYGPIVMNMSRGAAAGVRRAARGDVHSLTDRKGSSVVLISR